MNDNEMRALLERSRTIAVVGLSDKPDRASNRIARYLIAMGYNVIPVNPMLAEVLDLKSYPDLISIPVQVDIVDIFRRSEHVPPLVEQAIEIGAQAVWMQLGVMNSEAAASAEAAGLGVVMNRCIMVEHGRLDIAPIKGEDDSAASATPMEPAAAKLLEEIAGSVYDGQAETVAELVQRVLDQGLPAADVLSGGLITGMDAVGRDFKAGDLFVPEVLIAARAMRAGMGVLRPLLAESDVPTAGKILIGTVQGDLHDIGKNLVRMMLEGAGFDLVDLGVDVKPAGFVAAVQEHQPAIVAMSALLTTTMPGMTATLDALQEAGLRDTIKVMIGGAPVTTRFAEQIGADGFAPDTASAVELARELTAKTSR